MIELLLSLFLSTFGTAMPPPVEALPAEGAILSAHADGMLSMTAPLIDEGSLAATFGDPDRAKQWPDAATPTLRTKWTDAAGVEHEVVTPIASVTPSGLKKAQDLHTKLVKLMQTQYPPAPPNVGGNDLPTSLRGGENAGGAGVWILPKR